MPVFNFVKNNTRVEKFTEEKKKELLSTKSDLTINGQTYRLSQGALAHIKNGTINSYTPVDEEEKKTLENFKNNYKVDIIDSKGVNHGQITYNEYLQTTSKNPVGSATIEKPAYENYRNLDKLAEIVQKKQMPTKTTTLPSVKLPSYDPTVSSSPLYKAVAAERQYAIDEFNAIYDPNGIAAKYGYSAIDFDGAALKEWADNNNHVYTYNPNTTIGVLNRTPGSGIASEFYPNPGYAPQATQEQIEDGKVLYALALNNSNREISQQDNWGGVIQRYLSGLTWGLGDMLTDKVEEAMYTKAGFDKDYFVPYTSRVATFNEEHPVAGFVAEVAGTITTSMGVGSAVSGALKAAGWGVGKAVIARAATVQGITGALRGGITTAAAGGDWGDIGINALREGLTGAAGGAIGGIAEKGLTKLLNNSKYATSTLGKLKNLKTTAYGVNAIGGITDALADYKTDQIFVGIANNVFDANLQERTGKDLLTDFAVSLVLGTAMNMRSNTKAAVQARVEDVVNRYGAEYMKYSNAIKDADVETKIKAGEEFIETTKKFKKEMNEQLFPGKAKEVETLHEMLDVAIDSTKMDIDRAKNGDTNTESKVKAPVSTEMKAPIAPKATTAVKAPVSTEGGTVRQDVSGAIERVENGTATNKDLDMFKASKEANRKMLEDALGMKLPETNNATRKLLKELPARLNPTADNITRLVGEGQKASVEASIEKIKTNLEGTGKDVNEVVSGVSNLTNRTVAGINKVFGIEADYGKILDTNLKALADNPDNIITEDFTDTSFVKGYAEAIGEKMEGVTPSALQSSYLNKAPVNPDVAQMFKRVVDGSAQNLKAVYDGVPSKVENATGRTDIPTLEEYKAEVLKRFPNAPEGLIVERYNSYYAKPDAANNEVRIDVTNKVPEGLEKTVKAIKARTGIDIVFGRRMVGDNVDPNFNGVYDGKRIVVSENATKKDVFNAVVVHELTHGIEGTKQYKDISDFVIKEAYGALDSAEFKTAVDNKIKEYEGFGVKLTPESAKTEIVAENVQKYIFNDNVEGIVSKNYTLGQKILDVINELILKIRKRFGDTVDLTDLETAQRRYRQALEQVKGNKEVKDLIATHNMSASQFIEALGRGELLAPSAAVTNKGHTDFGEISVVFTKNTIDPEVDAQNRLYGADAWTPTQTTLKINPEFDSVKTDAVVNRIKNDIGEGAEQLFPTDSAKFQNDIASAQGSVYGAYAEDIGMQTAYAIESGIIKEVPRTNGVIDVESLKTTLDSALNQDKVWRQYKKWLSGISDDIITSYDKASTKQILDNMNAQPSSAKVFNLSESGELTVPAASYKSIDEMRSNKNRLSTDAEAKTKEAGGEFVNWANTISQKTGTNVSDVVKAINSSFGNRYDARNIMSAFADNGINLTRTDAQTLQKLYKKAVELPTPYFEAKPQRAVPVDEIAHVVLPDNISNKIKSQLDEKGIPYITYKAGDNADRIAKVNSLEDVKFKFASQQGKNSSDFGINEAYGTEQFKKWFGDWQNEPEYASKVVNEDGTPMIVYHGSDAKFNVFDMSKGRANMDIQGSFFTPWELDAQGYGGDVRAFYLNIKNPADGPTAYAALNRFKGQNEAGKKAKEYLIKQGYDGVNFYDEEYVAFYPNQIKSATDNIGTFDRNNPDVRYSFSSQNDIDNAMADFEAHYGEMYRNLGDEYGTIKPGEIPQVEDVKVPKKSGERQYVSNYARTMAETKVFSDAMQGEFEKMVVDGTLSHERISNKSAESDAGSRIVRLGFEGAVNEFETLVNSGRLNKNDIALGQTLLNVACQNKDVELAKKLAVDLSMAATQFGQNVQAFSMLKRMSPDGQLYYLEKTVQKINEGIAKKYKGKKSEVEIDPKLAEDLLNAKTQDEITEAVHAIEKNIGKQMPTNWVDKWNAWRYLAMLGNTRTHIRNIVGNMAFVPVRKVRDIIGATLEKALPKAERTKSYTKSSESKDFAKQDFEKMKEVVKGNEGKYDTQRGIEEHRKIFKTKWLEAVRKFNGDALEIEDGWFLKGAYEDAFAQAMTARGLSTEYLNSGTKEANADLQKIREYAIQEAQKATYRDSNKFSEVVSKIGFKGDNIVSKTANVFVEGILPFKKTPANILVRGVEYSPVGFIKTLTVDSIKLKKGDISASKFIDNLSSGLTGVGIAVLGAFLAKQGILVVSPDEDEDVASYKKMLGAQNYAIKIGDNIYTIDWMAPSSLPLFVGAETYNTSKATEGFTFKNIADAFSRISEPMFELSCLSGVQDALESIKYAESGNVVTSLLTDAVASYVSQALPTIGGQFARMLDDTQRNAYYKEKNSNLPAVVESFINKAKAKIPFASKMLPEKVDRWGRTQKYGGTAERALENFVSPGYYSKEAPTWTDNRILSIYEKTGDERVIPSTAPKSFEVKGERVYLTADQYVEYSKTKGQLSYKYVTEFLKIPSNIDDETRVEIISAIYEYSNAKAKEKVSDYELAPKYQKVDDAMKRGTSPAKYYFNYYKKKKKD